METGLVVEYIDGKKILCAVVKEVRKKRLRLLTQNNREVNFSENRLSYKGDSRIDSSSSRDATVYALKKIAKEREELTNEINIQELWEVLKDEKDWIDLPTMTELCFANNTTCNHESAVVRALFKNRFYFKFDHDRFFPNSKEDVKRNILWKKEAIRQDEIIIAAGTWLKSVAKSNNSLKPEEISDDKIEYIDILKSFFLFGKQSDHHILATKILKKANVDVQENLLKILINLGVFDENENIELHRHKVSVNFSIPQKNFVLKLVKGFKGLEDENHRKDFTNLPLITIDGQSTMDFDDSISLEDKGDFYLLGIHISDVAHVIRKNDILDKEARIRGSSIYMPDQKISMLPQGVSEDLCSLIAGKLRPAISVMVKITKNGDILDFEITPSKIIIKHQLSYYNVNRMADTKKDIKNLINIAKRFRDTRFAHGAIQITLPDTYLGFDENNEVTFYRTDRDSPARMLISEIMIMANWLMAKFIVEHKIPAIFRSQPDPRERLYKGKGETLFKNLMQRKLLSRFILQSSPDHHSGLGLEAYVTATSPIRKYFDLVTQRQIRSIFGLEKPYTAEEIDRIIQDLTIPMSVVSKIQYSRNRYWLLKYLEKRVGKKEVALVLFKGRNRYQVLLKEYMLECLLHTSPGINLKPEEVIDVTIQHANARNDVVAVFLS